MEIAELPEDIKENWFKPIRQAQSACKDNEGIAIVTLSVVVIGNNPIVWKEADVSKIHPKGIMDDIDALAPILALLKGQLDID